MNPRQLVWITITTVVLAGGYANTAAAETCKSRSRTVPGTLAAPSAPCPPPAKTKQEPQKKSPPPDPFWSGVYIGGSVSTSTTIRGR